MGRREDGREKKVEDLTYKILAMLEAAVYCCLKCRR
jgi:hypothetical protein